MEPESSSPCSQKPTTCPNRESDKSNPRPPNRHQIIIIIIIIIISKASGIETTDKWYTHVPKPVCEEGDVTVLWNQAVHTDREVTANRPDIITKNKKTESKHTDRCGNSRREKCCAKGNGKEVKIQEFMYRDTTNVEPEMYDYTSNN